MRRARLWYLLPALLSLCGVPAAPAKAVAASPALPALQNAEEMGQDLFVLSGSVGMVLVVVRDDQVFFHGYGETAPGSHQLPSQDSVLRLCSLTKIFTTDVLSKLATDRIVRLDDPLQRYAPKRMVVPTRGDSPITLVDLATHTAGLSREIAGAPPHTPHFTYPDYKTRWRWLPKQRLHNAPGSSALYSNVGFDLLSDALSSATHKQYAALLAERTLNPLHMVHTTFFPNDVQCNNLLVHRDRHGDLAEVSAP
ncbi:MAG: serine hydrolase [Acidobacteria bacterium]|nr:serine hydrolase [Acidobacteriota bacterium]